MKKGRVNRAKIVGGTRKKNNPEVWLGLRVPCATYHGVTIPNHVSILFFVQNFRKLSTVCLCHMAQPCQICYVRIYL